LAQYSAEFALVEVIRADASDIHKELAAGISDAFQRFGTPCKQNQVLEALSAGASAFSQFIDGLGSIAKSSKNSRLPTIILPIDQLEYLLRYGENTKQIWDLLAEVSASNSRILVIATMRSEYSGSSNTQQELFNLAPIGSAEYRDAMVGPAEACGVKIDPPLTDRLLNDLANASNKALDMPMARADKLPLLQYTLNRMWLQVRECAGDHSANEGPLVLRLSDYEAIGGLGALDTHGNQLVKDLAEAGYADFVEPVFRSLISGTTVAEAVRRPRKFGELVAVGGGDEQAVRKVVDVFRARGANFLAPESGPLNADLDINISSEILIRQWTQLSTWLLNPASNPIRLK
jgi:hypothetical protein